MFAGLMQLPLLALLVLPGILSRDVFADLDNPDLAWPSLVFEFVPVGLRGLIVAALLAALMSTLDSVLSGASSPSPAARRADQGDLLGGPRLGHADRCLVELAALDAYQTSS